MTWTRHETEPLALLGLHEQMMRRFSRPEQFYRWIDRLCPGLRSELRVGPIAPADLIDEGLQHLRARGFSVTEIHQSLAEWFSRPHAVTSRARQHLGLGSLIAIAAIALWLAPTAVQTEQTARDETALRPSRIGSAIGSAGVRSVAEAETRAPTPAPRAVADRLAHRGAPTRVKLARSQRFKAPVQPARVALVESPSEPDEDPRRAAHAEISGLLAAAGGACISEPAAFRMKLAPGPVGLRLSPAPLETEPHKRCVQEYLIARAERLHHGLKELGATELRVEFGSAGISMEAK